MSDSLKEYIQRQLEKGIPVEKIVNTLLETGYRQEEVSEALKNTDITKPGKTSKHLGSKLPIILLLVVCLVVLGWVFIFSPGPMEEGLYYSEYFDSYLPELSGPSTLFPNDVVKHLETALNEYDAELFYFLAKKTDREYAMSLFNPCKGGERFDREAALAACEEVNKQEHDLLRIDCPTFVGNSCKELTLNLAARMLKETNREFYGETPNKIPYKFKLFHAGEDIKGKRAQLTMGIIWTGEPIKYQTIHNLTLVKELQDWKIDNQSDIHRILFAGPHEFRKTIVGLTAEEVQAMTLEENKNYITEYLKAIKDLRAWNKREFKIKKDGVITQELFGLKNIFPARNFTLRIDNCADYIDFQYPKDTIQLDSNEIKVFEYNVSVVGAPTGVYKCKLIITHTGGDRYYHFDLQVEVSTEDPMEQIIVPKTPETRTTPLEKNTASPPLPKTEKEKTEEYKTRKEEVMRENEYLVSPMSGFGVQRGKTVAGSLQLLGIWNIFNRSETFHFSSTCPGGLRIEPKSEGEITLKSDEVGFMQLELDATASEVGLQICDLLVKDSTGNDYGTVDMRISVN